VRETQEAEHDEMLIMDMNLRQYLQTKSSLRCSTARKCLLLHEQERQLVEAREHLDINAHQKTLKLNHSRRNALSQSSRGRARGLDSVFSLTSHINSYTASG
jgi:hypothetical protein